MATTHVRKHTRVIPTRESTIRLTRHLVNLGKMFYIYQIGGHWMATTESLEVTQSKYKLQIRNWACVA